MYFDEDGDLAHEFYEQRVVKRRRGRRRVVMCKCSDNLVPQVLFIIMVITVLEITKKFWVSFREAL